VVEIKILLEVVVGIKILLEVVVGIKILPEVVAMVEIIITLEIFQKKLWIMILKNIWHKQKLIMIQLK
jgi:hypothetical protein